MSFSLCSLQVLCFLRYLSSCKSFQKLGYQRGVGVGAGVVVVVVRGPVPYPNLPQEDVREMASFWVYQI